MRPVALDQQRDAAYLLISPKQIPRIHLLRHIIQTPIIPIRNDRLAPLFELFQIIHHLTAEERASILQCRLVDDDDGAFGFDTFHDALDGGLA